MKFFELEKKKDGVYRCKGGHLADVLLLGGGIVYLFFLCIFSPIINLFRRNSYAGLNKEQKNFLKKFE